MKNIFIEGIQEMGKSMLLNHLARQKPEYHICREGDYSPVDLAWCTWMTEEEYNQVLRVFFFSKHHRIPDFILFVG